jgi:hypothetical protein
MGSSPHRQSKSMFPSAWDDTRCRVLDAPDAEYDEFKELVRVLERGASHLAILQDLHDRREMTRAPATHLLEFVDADLTDLFRSMVGNALDLLPGKRQWERADPNDVLADVKTLIRYLSVAVLAAEHSSVPGELRGAFRAVAAGLKGWDDEVIAAVERLAERHLPPANG